MYQWHLNDCEIDAIGIGDQVPEELSAALPTDVTEYPYGTDLTDYQPDESYTSVQNAIWHSYDWEINKFYSVPEEISSTEVPDSSSYQADVSEDSSMPDLNSNPIETIRQCVQQCFKTFG